MVYHGWEIYAYKGTLDKNRLTSILRKHFSDEEWLFVEDRGKIGILYKPMNFEVEVTFFDENSDFAEKPENAKKCKVLLKSRLMGFRDIDEERHKKFYEEVLRRIPRWKKVGYWLEDYERVLKPRIKPARPR